MDGSYSSLAGVDEELFKNSCPVKAFITFR